MDTYPKECQNPLIGCNQQSTNSRVQVVEFMSSSGRKLPAVASLPNVGFAPGVIQLAAFTGPRFFQSIAEPNTMGPDTRITTEGSVQEGSGRLEGEFDHCSQVCPSSLMLLLFTTCGRFARCS